MKRPVVYYVGAYCGEEPLQRKNARQNIAGTAKMNYICRCLKQLGYMVHVVAIAPAHSGFSAEETVRIDAQEQHTYLPALVVRVLGKNIVRGDLSCFFLKRWLRRHVQKEDTVLSYHSLYFDAALARAHRRIGFRWAQQIEEIYCMSSSVHQDFARRAEEEALFAFADSYLFVNDLMPALYAGKKPFAVSYGNGEVKLPPRKAPVAEEPLYLVYAGICNESGGVFRLLRVMPLLPARYRLRVLGMGEAQQLARLGEEIAALNAREGFARAEFCGARTGAAYTEFLGQCHIGVSLLDTADAYSQNAFPSKLLAYLGHGLRVVSTRNACVEESAVADLITFCGTSLQEAADAVQRIDFSVPFASDARLAELDARFRQQLRAVVDARAQTTEREDTP